MIEQQMDKARRNYRRAQAVARNYSDMQAGAMVHATRNRVRELIAIQRKGVFF